MATEKKGLDLRCDTRGGIEWRSENQLGRRGEDIKGLGEI
jgi:hypothetical protein